MAESEGLLLVHGDEPHHVDATVRQWRASATDVEIIDAPARLEPLIASLVDMPLFAAERHVLVRDLLQLTDARRGGSGVAELGRALAMRAPSTHVCFAVRAVVSPRNPILEAIVASGGRVVFHKKLSAAERRQWIDGEVRRRRLRLPPGGAEVLLRCSGGDLGAMSGELDKIGAVGGTPNLEQLRGLVAGAEQLELYRVIELLGGERPAQGAALLTGLIHEGRSTQYLLSILAGQLRDVLIAHALLLRGQRGSAALAAALRLPAWRADRVARTAGAIPAALAIAWMRRLQRIDARLKAGEVDDAAALQQWGLSAAQALGDRRNRARSG